jgi:hypothetical protein
VAKKTAAILILVIALAALVARAQQVGSWSDWRSTNTADMQYRVLLDAYASQIQFRNMTNQKVKFDYAAWIQGQDRPAEGFNIVIGPHDTSVQDTINATVTSPKVTRVSISYK